MSKRFETRGFADELFVPYSRGILRAIQGPAPAPALCIAMIESATGMSHAGSRESTDLANFILACEAPS